MNQSCSNMSNKLVYCKCIFTFLFLFIFSFLFLFTGFIYVSEILEEKINIYYLDCLEKFQ